MIVGRLARGVWQHAGVRFTEWLGAAPLIGIGFVLWDEYDVFGVSPTFAVMEQWASEATWANALLAAGLMRLIALIINGSFPQLFRHSPTMRFIASWIAMMAWAAVALGMFSAWREFGGSPTGWVMYGSWSVLELRNLYCSRVDMVLARGKADAGA